jgi:hypothetical protein
MHLRFGVTGITLKQQPTCPEYRGSLVQVHYRPPFRTIGRSHSKTSSPDHPGTIEVNRIQLGKHGLLDTHKRLLVRSISPQQQAADGVESTATGGISELDCPSPHGYGSHRRWASAPKARVETLVPPIAERRVHEGWPVLTERPVTAGCFSFSANTATTEVPSSVRLSIVWRSQAGQRVPTGQPSFTLSDSGGCRR